MMQRLGIRLLSRVVNACQLAALESTNGLTIAVVHQIDQEHLKGHRSETFNPQTRSSSIR